MGIVLVNSDPWNCWCDAGLITGGYHNISCNVNMILMLSHQVR